MLFALAQELFEALIFTVMACGYRVRCALEEDDSGDIRLEKLARLIGNCPRSIHDLSRIELAANDLPRFNMPFELGMALGAKKFGGRPHNNKSIKIMVAEPYRLPAYLSDLGGNDPSAHHRDPERVIVVVRDYLHEGPDGAILAGPSRMKELYQEFRTAIPTIAESIRHRPDEIGGLVNYKTFVLCVTEYLRAELP